jgi:hypothetical protein
MNKWRTTLPKHIQAAIAADLNSETIRGLLVIVETIAQNLNPRTLPQNPDGIIAALCQELTRWVVVSSDLSPYAYVRQPLEVAGVAIATLDLRKVQPDDFCPEEMNPAIWPQVLKAAKRYHDAHPAPADTTDTPATERAHERPATRH